MEAVGVHYPRVWVCAPIIIITILHHIVSLTYVSFVCNIAVQVLLLLRIAHQA